MIYLALDTNIWLYLSNGFDPVKQNYHKALHTDSHFELLNSLTKKIQTEEITVLINDVIISEWDRNKKHTNNLIQEVHRNKQHLYENLMSLKPYLKEESRRFIINEVQREILNKSELQIKRNKEHIENVEKFLKNFCKKIAITDQHLIQAARLAIEKKAPFHNGKNNVADAVILLSVISCLDELRLGELNHAIFVSNNTSEFADDPINPELQFHPDIVLLLKGKALTYKRHLGDAIELGEDLLQQLEYYFEYKEFVANQRKFGCLLPHCDNETSFGYFDLTIKVFTEKDFSLNPNQLTLFEFSEDERKNLSRIRQTEMGRCLSCNTTHIICPNCSAMTCDPEDWNNFLCTECDTEYRIKPHPLLKEDCLAEMEKVEGY